MNESLSGRIVSRLDKNRDELGWEWSSLDVLVSGFAYKGVPQTDDVRGSAVLDILPMLKQLGCRGLYGHDFIVSEGMIASLGATPISLEDGIKKCQIILILNNHPQYAEMDFHLLLDNQEDKKMIYDLWGVLREKSSVLQTKCNFYQGVGFGV